jgi:hypothetical protein
MMNLTIGDRVERIDGVKVGEKGTVIEAGIGRVRVLWDPRPATEWVSGRPTMRTYVKHTAVRRVV